MSSYTITGRLLVEATHPVMIVNQHLLNNIVTGFAADSREVKAEGTTFAAVSLPKTEVAQRIWYRVYNTTPTHFFNYHQYIDQAIENGARFVLCERLPGMLRDDVLYLVVPNVISALGQIAKYMIVLTRTKVVAVTGSSGKTTTTQAIYSVLRQGLPNVGKVYTYRPTPISLPLSILNLYCTELGNNSCLVLEMPTDHHGCITTMSQIARPDVAVVLNVIDAHIRSFGSADEIARAKSEIVTSSSEQGVLVLNFDDPRVRGMARLARTREVLSFGVSENTKMLGKVLRLYPHSTTIEVVHDGDQIAMAIPLIGPSSVYIALAATAVGSSFGMSLSEIALALSNFELMPGRMSWKFCDNGRVTIFDNSAKTNTTNLRHLISAVTTAGWIGHKILVLGQFDFHEHPDLEPEVWATIGNFFDDVVLVGREARPYESKIKGLSGSSVANTYLADTLEGGSQNTIKLINQTQDKCYLVVTGHEFVELDKLVIAVVQSYE